MLLVELLESDGSNGTYAAAKLSSESRNIISNFIKDNNIKNSSKISELHSTLIYSRIKINNFKEIKKYPKPLKCKSGGLEIWKTRPSTDTGETKSILVLRLRCPEFVERHKNLMSMHKEATYDYPNFKPHVTLSYDIGDDFDLKKIDKFEDSIYLTGEYADDIID